MRTLSRQSIAPRTAASSLLARPSATATDEARLSLTGPCSAMVALEARPKDGSGRKLIEKNGDGVGRTQVVAADPCHSYVLPTLRAQARYQQLFSSMQRAEKRPHRADDKRDGRRSRQALRSDRQGSGKDRRLAAKLYQAWGGEREDKRLSHTHAGSGCSTVSTGRAGWRPDGLCQPLDRRYPA